MRLVPQSLSCLIRQGSVDHYTALSRTFPETIPEKAFDILPENRHPLAVQLEVQQLREDRLRIRRFPTPIRHLSQLFESLLRFVPPHVFSTGARVDVSEDMQRRLYAPDFSELMLVAEAACFGKVQVPFGWIVSH